MATKKQKRQAAQEKRQKFLEEQRRIGEAAQQADKQRREAQSQRVKEEAARFNRRMEAILAELRGEWKSIAPLQGPPPDYDAMEAQAAYDDFWGRY